CPNPQPGPAPSRPQILVPTVLSALGVVFTLGMLIGRIPHSDAARSMAVAARNTIFAPAAGSRADVAPDEASPSDGVKTVGTTSDVTEPVPMPALGFVALAPITAHAPVGWSPHPTKAERGQVVAAMPRRTV